MERRGNPVEMNRAGMRFRGARWRFVVFTFVAASFGGLGGMWFLRSLVMGSDGKLGDVTLSLIVCVMLVGGSVTLGRYALDELRTWRLERQVWALQARWLAEDMEKAQRN